MCFDFIFKQIEISLFEFVQMKAPVIQRRVEQLAVPEIQVQTLPVSYGKSVTSICDGTSR